MWARTFVLFGIPSGKKKEIKSGLFDLQNLRPEQTWFGKKNIHNLVIMEGQHCVFCEATSIQSQTSDLNISFSLIKQSPLPENWVFR